MWSIFIGEKFGYNRGDQIVQAPHLFPRWLCGLRYGNAHKVFHTFAPFPFLGIHPTLSTLQATARNITADTLLLSTAIIAQGPMRAAIASMSTLTASAPFITTLTLVSGLCSALTRQLEYVENIGEKASSPWRTRGTSCGPLSPTLRCFISVLLSLLPAYTTLLDTIHVPTPCYNKRRHPVKGVNDSIS